MACPGQAPGPNVSSGGDAGAGHHGPMEHPVNLPLRILGALALIAATVTVLTAIVYALT